MRSERWAMGLAYADVAALSCTSVIWSVAAVISRSTSSAVVEPVISSELSAIAAPSRRQQVGRAVGDQA
jgi:hypothetical protein